MIVLLVRFLFLLEGVHFIAHLCAGGIDEFFGVVPLDEVSLVARFAVYDVSDTTFLGSAVELFVVTGIVGVGHDIDNETEFLDAVRFDIPVNVYGVHHFSYVLTTVVVQVEVRTSFGRDEALSILLKNDATTGSVDILNHQGGVTRVLNLVEDAQLFPLTDGEVVSDRVFYVDCGIAYLALTPHCAEASGDDGYN